MDAQQELFTELLIQLKAKALEKGYEVYDGALPPEGTPYPFVYLADFRQSENETKSQIIGTVYPVIHVWHNNPRQRGTVSSIIIDIKEVCRRVEHTNNYAWLCKIPNQRIFNDTTTKTALVHGVIEPEFTFS